MDRTRFAAVGALSCALCAWPAGTAALQLPADSSPAPSPVAPRTARDSAPPQPSASGAAVPGTARSVGAAGPHTDARALQYDTLVQGAGTRLERAMLLEREDEDGRMPLVQEAERYARAAAALMPERAEGWFLIAASVGMRCEYAGLRQQIQLASEIRQAAITALELDSAHAGAHHVMGRLNFEAMKLSGMSRLIASRLFGSNTMREASWEAAERHLRRAAELEPNALVHRLWLARLHRARGDRQAARHEYQVVLSRRAATELDRKWRDEAGVELRGL